MIQIKLKRETLSKIKNVKELDSFIKKGLRHAGHEIGRESVKLTAKLIETGKKTGRIYRINGRNHQASAPGESPANLTGALVKSLGYSARGYKEVVYFANTPYAAKLEYGPFGKPEEKRPYLARCNEIRDTQNTRTIEYHVYKEIKNGLRNR